MSAPKRSVMVTSVLYPWSSGSGPTKSIVTESPRLSGAGTGYSRPAGAIIGDLLHIHTTHVGICASTRSNTCLANKRTSVGTCMFLLLQIVWQHHGQSGRTLEVCRLGKTTRWYARYSNPSFSTNSSTESKEANSLRQKGQRGRVMFFSNPASCNIWCLTA